MLILENNHSPMRKLTQPWKLRRSFGSQPVGNVAGPRWTEAGITAQVIPSQSSRRTLRGKVDTHCRPADLPTYRPTDLPTCRPADLVVDDQRDSSPRTLPRPQLRRLVHIQQECRGACLKPSLENTQALPRPSNCSDVFFGNTARHNLPQFSLPH